MGREWEGGTREKNIIGTRSMCGGMGGMGWVAYRLGVGKRRFVLL